MRYIDCMNCGSDRTVPLTRTLEHGVPGTVVLCRHCGLGYRNPQPDAGELDAYYTTAEFWATSYRETAGAPSEAYVAVARNRGLSVVQWLRRHEIPVSSVLDIGCGYGVMLDTVRQECGCDALGVEPGANAAKYAQECLHLRVRRGMFSKHLVADATPGIVTAMHVLEHAENPIGFLRQVLEVVGPRGALVVEVPNMRKRYDSLGLSTHFFSYPHLFYFTPTTLQSVLGLAGWQVLDTFIGAENEYNIRVLAAPMGSPAQTYLRDKPLGIRVYLWQYGIRAAAYRAVLRIADSVRRALRASIVFFFGERLTRRLLALLRGTT